MNTNSITTAVYYTAGQFFRLADAAARHGGFWVSAGGGTANVVAGILSRHTGASFEETHRALDVMGRLYFGDDDWYQAMASLMPWPVATIPCDPDTGEWWSRWRAATVARAACRKKWK